jgi:hypothetical protein
MQSRGGAGARDFCVLQNVQSGSGFHSASHSVGIGSSFVAGKVAGA